MITIPHSLIELALQRVLTSRCFRARKILQSFLSHIVTCTLKGNLSCLTQQVIAQQALGKRADFDPSIDPSVRVQAGRLRDALLEYYQTEGRFDDVFISLPVGSYQASFRYNHIPPEHQVVQRSKSGLTLGPSIVCVARQPKHATESDWLFLNSLISDYSNLLMKFNFFQVHLHGEIGFYVDKSDFNLYFDLLIFRGEYSLQCSLVTNATQKIEWSHKFNLGTQHPSPKAIEVIFKLIAHETVSYERGIAHDVWVRQLLMQPQSIAEHQQVLVALRQHLWDINANSFRNACLVCEQRLQYYPHDTQALLVYAELIRGEYLSKFNVMPEPIERLKYTGRQLMHLDAGNAYSHFFRAAKCMLEGDYEQTLSALQVAESINRLDSHLNVSIGLVYMGMEQWHKGAEYIQDSMSLSARYPEWYHIPICIYHYREGRYIAALRHAMRIKSKTVWTPTLRASLFQRMNKSSKALMELNELMRNFPEYEQAHLQLTNELPQGFQTTMTQLVKDAEESST